MDIADAVNVMTYASDPTPGQDDPRAAWDIFPAGDSDKLREFILLIRARLAYEEEVENQPKPKLKLKSRPKPDPYADQADEKAKWIQARIAAQKRTGHDVIHDQQTYLSEDLLVELRETFGVRSWRIYQRVGEAVFIPAGCAHQVCNMADCIKVACDFVSIENVDRCSSVTSEFRRETKGKRAWREDVLQLKNMVYWAWQACLYHEQGLPSPTPPPQIQAIRRSNKVSAAKPVQIKEVVMETPQKQVDQDVDVEMELRENDNMKTAMDEVTWYWAYC